MIIVAYLLLGIAFILMRTVLLVWLMSSASRGFSPSHTSIDYVIAILLWPVEILVFAGAVLGAISETWSERRTAKRMGRTR